jgi:hypothetical protein
VVTAAVRGATITYTGRLVVEECCECHITFAMPADFQRRCSDAGPAMSFYCPAGHKQHYTASETAQLKYKLTEARKRADRAETRERAARDQADAAERSARAYKGHLTRTRKRIGNGTCPCCNRHFANVERHMHSQHPGYAEAEAAQ